MDKVLAFWRDEEGATAVEYGIIAGLMAILLLAVFGESGTFGVALQGAFTKIAGIINPA